MYLILLNGIRKFIEFLYFFFGGKVVDGVGYGFRYISFGDFYVIFIFFVVKNFNVNKIFLRDVKVWFFIEFEDSLFFIK